ncbi:MAG: REP-associated tyrosine transposase [Fimbriimonas sp.]
MRKPEEIATAFSPREALDGKSRFFLVGIGGAGMSALARMLKTRGFEVMGTDSTLSPEVERLRSEGIEVHVGHAGAPLQEFARGTGVPPVGIPSVPLGSGTAGETQKRHGANLPHWTQEGATYAVTFRLADAVPTGVQEEWKVERERLEEMDRIGLISARDRLEYGRLLSEKIRDYLDAGHGDCLLRQPTAANVVRESLAYFDGQRYDLDAWCVMPNHVHALIRPRPSHELKDILHGWKSFTAKEINRRLGREGSVWQTEYDDHLIRDEGDYRTQRDYILANPLKAGLGEWTWVGSAPEPERDARDTHGRDARATTAVVLTDAIDLGKSPEVAAAKELGLPTFRRSQALGWLLKPYKVIAVTGTHGKTTTTGMTGAGMIAAGLDPLVVVGAAIPQWGGPVREGQGEWAVVEACEAYDAFHDLDPEIVVLTNLELDHVDYHGTWENLKGSVLRFVSRIPEDGALVYCAEDSGATEIAEAFAGRKVRYELENRATPPMRLPGRHNHLNMWAAVEAGVLAGGAVEKIWAEIPEFTGAERRLQVLQTGDVTVVDDYAHHPTEIEASLKALRDRYFGGPVSDPERDDHATSGRLIVVYQPHLYSRTAPLISEFAEALSVADHVVITDIYPAREDPIPGVSSARIAEKVTKAVTYVPSRHLLPIKVAKLVQPGDVVVGMGAGNIAEFGPKFIAELGRRAAHRKRIAVLYGGDSAEREVSILSGRAIHGALQALGHDSYLLDATELLLSKGDLSQFLGPGRPDLAFLAVHGTHAEDGAIQGLLELLHIPYTGSGIQASAIAMDKGLTKRVLEAAGIRTPKGVLLRSMDDTPGIPPPLVVKPNAQGSTVGLKFVERGGDLCAALAYSFQYDDAVVVEEWIRGMEISVPVLDDEALPPVEIAPASGTYDFESKYTPGATEEIVPARLPAAVLQEAKATALKAHRALGCAGATRTDMLVRIEGDRHEIFVLEVNTLPGMTGTSLLPSSAQAVGISFEALCQRLVEDALRRNAAKA